jgi:glycosyltransferase involved in cell wall biosynthesis
MRRLGLCMIVKNESHVIERSLRSALPQMDTWSIVDTGSTDDTMAIIRRVTKELGKPGVLHERPWVDFGHNRTEALALARDTMEWIFMLDADDSLHGAPIPREALLDDVPGYFVTLREGACEYTRIQLFNAANDWSYIGVLHEYAMCSDYGRVRTLPSETWIHGTREGARNKTPDKYLRDAAILEEHLKTTKDRSRTLFYLAQSYRDANRFDDAIRCYKDRVHEGGWIQETWYSMYQLARLYADKKDWIEMEYWGQKAYALLPSRSESLYLLTKTFRQTNQFWKAWEYMTKGKTIPKPLNNPLFLEVEPYTHLFDYEKTILSYYVYPERRETLKEILDYYGQHPDPQTYLNLQFYVRPTCILRSQPLGLHCGESDFNSSSTSICPNLDGTYTLNIRHVNYRQENNVYTPMVNGVLDPSAPIRTRNFAVRVSSTFEPLTPLQEMIPESNPVQTHANVLGLEDLRLYRTESGDLRCMATARTYLPTDTYRIIDGLYDVSTGRIRGDTVIHPPVETPCEKNWIPLPGDRFVYTWSPFAIGTIQASRLKLTSSTTNVPPLFRHLRGSTNWISWKGALWCVTHMVLHTTPRKYYHVIVKLRASDCKILGWTLPFYFFENNIEYTLGWCVKEDTATLIVSRNDSNPTRVDIDMNQIEVCPWTPDPTHIAVVVPVCSRNQSYESLADTPLMKRLLPSLEATQETGYTYTLYVGYDDDDEFYCKHVHEFPESIRVVRLTGCQQSPPRAWNALARKAVEDPTVSYVFQVGDDVVLETPGWTSKFVAYLQSKGNRAVAGPCSPENHAARMASGTPHVIENAFVHRSHVQLFDGMFHPSIQNWYCDDWISRVYDPFGSKIFTDSVCRNTVRDARYTIAPCPNLPELIEESRALLRAHEQ